MASRTSSLPSQLVSSGGLIKGSIIAALGHAVGKMRQPPRSAASVVLIARRVTKVDQSIACRSTLSPTFFMCSLSTWASMCRLD
jgi:hypothetical protein